MAQRGKPSIAHEFDERQCCIHCHMYKNVVDKIVHACKPWREELVDAAAAKKAGKTVREYRIG